MSLTSSHHVRAWLGNVFKRVTLKEQSYTIHHYSCPPDTQLQDYPLARIRNFCIIAHVDHGKSTLADRLLELTGAISIGGGAKTSPTLDTLEVEKRRGITVKAQTCSIFYRYQGASYLLNLIDTPGHVDFSYEVSRSLAAAQGALLVVDASQGIQAQTIANFWLAFSDGLGCLPIINKVDLSTADVEKTERELESQFDLQPSESIKISAKTGYNVQHVLEDIVRKLPPPKGQVEGPLRCLLFDARFDDYRGVVCYFTVIDGTLCKGDVIQSCHIGKRFDVLGLGLLTPEEFPVSQLYTGQMGYVILGMRNMKEACIGDTYCHPHTVSVIALPGFRKSKPMVFAGVYPLQSSQYDELRSAIDKLALNDNALSLQDESSSVLGRGWRLGFLGSLHMSVFKERLEDEFKTDIVFTAPTVSYQLYMRNGETHTVHSVEAFPDAEDLGASKVNTVQEPMLLATILTPEAYLGKVLALCLERRGTQKDLQFLGTDRVLLKVILPLSEVMIDFLDELKSLTSGYASFDYEEAGYATADIVKVHCLLNHRVVPDLSLLTHKSKAVGIGRQMVERLSKVIHRQLFEVVIQAVIGSKVIARETLPALRKDVTAKCYGGDRTRRLKLLERQKEGKKKLKLIGQVELSHQAFLSIIKKS